MALEDLFEIADLFTSWQSLVWAIAGGIAGLVAYKILLPWGYAGWGAISVGFGVFIGGRAWHARRDSNRAASRGPN